MAAVHVMTRDLGRGPYAFPVKGAREVIDEVFDGGQGLGRERGVLLLDRGGEGVVEQLEGRDVGLERGQGGF